MFIFICASVAFLYFFYLNVLNYLIQQTLMLQPIWQPRRWQRTLQLWHGMVFGLRSMVTCWHTPLQREPAEKLKWVWTLLLTSWPLWNQESCTQFSSGPTRALVPVGRAWPKPRRVSCSPSGWGCGALPSLFKVSCLKRSLKGSYHYALISLASQWMEQWHSHMFTISLCT